MFWFPGTKGQGHVCLLFYHLIRWEVPVGGMYTEQPPASSSANLNINNPHSHEISLAFIVGMVSFVWGKKKARKYYFLLWDRARGQCGNPVAFPP